MLLIDCRLGSEQICSDSINNDMKKKESNSLKCLNCQKPCESLRFYSCCFKPSCSSCYQQSHSSKCKSQQQTTYVNIGAYDKASQSCSRCLIQLKSEFVACQQCRDTFCSPCFDQVHCKDKFLLHRKSKVGNRIKELFCIKHKKNKTVYTQANDILCPLCAVERKSKKPKDMFAVDLPSVESHLENTQCSIEDLKGRHEASFVEFKRDLDDYFYRIKEKINDKYTATLTSLERWNLFGSQLISKYDQEVSDCLLQMERFSAKDSPIKIMEDLLKYRVFFINEQLGTIKRNIAVLDSHQFKISYPSLDIMDSMLKCVSIQKSKLKCEEDEKENKSLRKSRISTQKLYSHGQSHRKSESVSRSQQKLSINVERNSHKKAMISSVIKNRQDIEPVLLKFGTNYKEGGRGSLVVSIRVQDEVQPEKVSEKLKPSYIKRKSQYLDMRDRLRNPNIHMQNRFDNPVK